MVRLIYYMFRKSNISWAGRGGFRSKGTPPHRQYPGKRFEMKAKTKEDHFQEFGEIAGKKGLIDRAVAGFREVIYGYYKEHRRPFPWRETTEPYHILVSEVMLQQTQTSRVEVKFREFVSAFPDFGSLADAPLRRVLEVWQGMGYNRRAVSLKRTAETVVSEHAGVLPDTEHELLKLPGIGPYTASAVCAFAFNKPTVLIETNIRRVFIHFFFQGQEKVKDSDIVPLVEQTMDRENLREWYSALMDYGVMLAKHTENPNRRSAHYAKQKAFEGSGRQLRGMVLRDILQEGGLSEEELVVRTGKEPERVRVVLGELEKEGFIREKGRKYVVEEK